MGMDIVRLLDHLGNQKADVVGYSLGTMVRRPQTIRNARRNLVVPPETAATPRMPILGVVGSADPAKVLLDVIAKSPGMKLAVRRGNAETGAPSCARLLLRRSGLFDRRAGQIFLTDLTR